MKGYILVAVLIFLSIFSAASLFNLSMFRQQLKLLDAKQQHLTDQHAAMMLLDDIEAKILRGESVEEVARNVTVENLGVEPCAIVQLNQPVNAIFYRITLAINPAPHSEHSQAHILLQSTLAKAAEKRVLCAENEYVVQVGRQSIRRMI